jgi:hypothetical protein
VFELCSLIADCEPVIFSTTKLQPTAQRSTFWLDLCCASARIRPFCGAGPASPAFQLVDPHALPLPFLPAATSSLLTTAPPTQQQVAAFVVNSSTFADNKSFNHAARAILHDETFAPTNQAGQFVPH